MNSLYVPADIQCFWCNGHMQQKGATSMGSGLNYISYFCKDCGGIAHFARHDDRNIKTFTINYCMGEKANRKTSNEETANYWLDDLPPMGGFHD